MQKAGYGPDKSTEWKTLPLHYCLSVSDLIGLFLATITGAVHFSKIIFKSCLAVNARYLKYVSIKLFFDVIKQKNASILDLLWK